MAHEITETDNVVLTKEKAWHNLGIVVENAPTPQEALDIAGLGWTIDQAPLTGRLDEEEIELPNHVVNIRSDTRQVMSVVSSDYKPIQNQDMVDFANALAEQDDIVRVESAGSVRGGKKVWFLLRGDSFSVRDRDEIVPYICLSTSHDGTNAFRATPTTIRVVCSNTLHMVVPDSDTHNTIAAAYTVRHIGDIRQNIEEAKAALRLYGKSVESTRETFDTLSRTDVGSREKLQAFWMDVYQKLQGPVPTAPSDKRERRVYEKATAAMGKIAERFDRDRDIAGPSAWNAVNAFTGWAQNERPVRGATQQAKEERRMHMNLFGITSDASDEALQLAGSSF